jgi:hypothetical protein
VIGENSQVNDMTHRWRMSVWQKWGSFSAFFIIFVTIGRDYGIYIYFLEPLGLQIVNSKYVKWGIAYSLTTPRMKLSHSLLKALHFYAYLNNFVYLMKKIYCKGIKNSFWAMQEKKRILKLKIASPSWETSYCCRKAFQASSRRHLLFCKETFEKIFKSIPSPSPSPLLPPFPFHLQESNACIT